MIKKMMEREIQPIHFYPGWKFNVKYIRTDENDNEIINELIECEVDEEMIVDKILIFKTENEYGFEKAYGVLMGKKKE